MRVCSYCKSKEIRYRIVDISTRLESYKFDDQGKIDINKRKVKTDNFEFMTGIYCLDCKKVEYVNLHQSSD